MLAACETPCQDGFGRDDDGYCVPLPGHGSDADTDADADTDVGYGPVEALLSDQCSPCHTGNSDAGGLNIQGYDDLVGAPSDQAPMDLVSTSGDRNDSYLWHKISGTQDSVGGSGQLMPDPNTPLSDDQLNTVRDWLDAGAPN